MPTTSRWAARPARATPASYGSKARTTSLLMATSCISGSIPDRYGIGVFFTSVQVALIADRAEMLVDAKHDQNEFRRDTRKYHSDDHAGDRRQQHDEPAERADRHCREAGEDAGDPEQSDQCDHQPVKCLDDRGRDEAVPLKQIPKFKHLSFPPAQLESQSYQNRSRRGTAPSPECAPPQDTL